MNHLTFSAALEMAEAQARSTLDASLHERLACAVALVKDGRVFQTNAGLWEVDSASTEGLVHQVNGTCDCHDAHFHKPPQGLCKHRLAVYLARRTLELMPQPPQPVVPLDGAPGQAPGALPKEIDVPAPDFPEAQAASPAPARSAAADFPLPEAAVSITIKGYLHGQDVMITLRGTDLATVLVQVEEAAQFLKAPQPQASSPPPELSPQQHNALAQGQKITQTGWCAVHNQAMKWNAGRDGKKGWFSHRYDGEWCKGR